jgi:hypothetical protein
VIEAERMHGHRSRAMFFGIQTVADGMEAVCDLEAGRASQIGKHSDALQWEIRSAFFSEAPHGWVHTAKRIEKTNREYAFDVKLQTVVRVVAVSEKEAREIMAKEIDRIEIGYDRNGVRIMEASIDDSSEDKLFEVDGANVKV